MRRRARHRFVLVLALFGWLAQVCLSMAHAAAMGESRAAGIAWCGKASPAWQAKLAQLPDEIRQMFGGAPSQSNAHLDCLKFCASFTSTATPPAPITVALRAAGLEVIAPPVVPAAHYLLAAPPPARGPPRLS